MSTATVAHRRKYRRTSVDIGVLVRTAPRNGIPQEQLGTVINISVRGIFIATPFTPPPVCSKIRLDFRIATDDAVTLIEGVVRWRTEGEAQGIGVELIHRDDRFLQNLYSFLDARQTPQAAQHA